MWKIILSGLPICFVNDIAGVVFYHLSGIPLIITVGIITVKWSLFLLLIFYGIEYVAIYLKRWRAAKAIIALIEKVSVEINGNTVEIYGKRKRKTRRKLTGWFVERKEWIVLSAGFIPYVPILPTAVIIAVRLMRIRYGLFFLLLGNAFKATAFCLAIYSLIPSS